MRARRHELIADRIAVQLVAGKSILDIGVVKHTHDATKAPTGYMAICDVPQRRALALMCRKRR